MAGGDDSFVEAKTLRKVDVILGVFFLLLGILVLTQALTYDFYQDDGIPGAGFLHDNP